MPDFDPANKTFLTESAQWPAQIFKLEDGYLPTGGDINDATGAGTMNRQAKGLADRTAWLKVQLEALQTSALSSSQVSNLIQTAINDLKGGASAAYDTLIELQNALTSNDSEIAALVGQLAAKMDKAQNLADLPDKGAARTNLGVGPGQVLSRVQLLPQGNAGTTNYWIKIATVNPTTTPYRDATISLLMSAADNEAGPHILRADIFVRQSGGGQRHAKAIIRDARGALFAGATLRITHDMNQGGLFDIWLQVAGNYGEIATWAAWQARAGVSIDWTPGAWQAGAPAIPAGGASTDAELVGQLVAKLEKAQNLADLPDKAAARVNLGANDAGNLTAGTIPNDRLPPRLSQHAAIITDWNDALQNGVYMADGAANAPTATGWYIGTVISHNVLWARQTLHAFTENSKHDSKTWIRDMDNGSWGPWYRGIATAAEVPTLGVGQTWQNVFSQRSSGTAYQNTTGRSILVSIATNAGGSDISVSADGSTWLRICYVGADPSESGAQFVVPPNHFYKLTGSKRDWLELR